MDFAQTYEVLNGLFLIPAIKAMLVWAWGVEDDFWVASLKRTFLVLPFLGLAFSYWATLLTIFSAVFRSQRKELFQTLIVSWWDWGRALFGFWSGVFQFAVHMALYAWSCFRIFSLGVWSFISDLFGLPFRLLGGAVNSALNPGVPWIAVTMTMAWCLLEAGIFTYVTSPLVMDTLSNLTGDNLSEAGIRIPLFLFMLFISLGSYSVLSSFTEAIQKRNVPTIAKIAAVEMVAVFVEVVFLYREFVDALVPWFAQHTSGKFELGIFGTLFIASLTWFGIRSLSWFLFASTGVPPIMAIVQGTGLKARKQDHGGGKVTPFPVTFALINQLQREANWFKNEGQKFVESFALPPLQIVAASLNFVMVFLQNRHLFQLPFHNLSDLKAAKALLEDIDKDRKKAA